jgi:hypothetical protein
MFEKLGLVEENDLEKYRKKLGIKRGVDLASIDVDDVDSILEASNVSHQAHALLAGDKEHANPKKRQTNLQKAKRQYDKD